MLGFASVQALVQALAFPAGLLVIRGLSRDEYAQYTVAFAVSTVTQVIASSGMTSAVQTLAGPRHSEPAAFADVIRTALFVRARILAFAAVPTGALLALLLIRLRTGWVLALIDTGIVLTTFGLVARSAIVHTALRLRYAFRLSQRIQLLAATGRLILLLGLLLDPLRSPTFALTCTMLAAACEWWAIKRYSRPWLALDGEVVPEFRASMARSARQLLPVNVYSAFQGQILILGLGVAGLAQTTAEIGGLSRYALVFNFAVLTAQGVLVPRFARLAPGGPVKRVYFEILSVIALSILSVLTLVILWRAPLLALLGDGYTHLEGPYILLMCGAALYAINMGLSALNQARGWLRGTWIYVPASLTTSLTLFAVLDLSTVEGAAMFGLISSTPGLVINGLRSLAGLTTTGSQGR